MGNIMKNGVSYSGGGGGDSTPHVELTKAEYDALVQAGTVDPDTVYMITDDTGASDTVYSKSQVDGLLATQDAAIATKVPEVGKGINLLDNWYFANADAIVDQRGGYVVPSGVTYYSDTALTTSAGTTSAYTTAKYVNSTYGSITVSSTTYYVAYSDMVRGYTGAGYGIDRWKSNQGSYQLTASGLVSGSDTLWTVQRFEAERLIIGEAYTISAIIDGKLLTKTKVIESTATSISVGSQADGIIGLAYSSGWYFQIITYKSQTIAAAKLELGSEQTLARNIGTDANPNWVLNDPPPNYGEELAKCQRYQFRTTTYQRHRACLVTSSGGTLQFFIPTPVTLRALPSAASLSGVVLETIPYNTPLPTGFTFSMGDLAGNGFFISATNSSGSELRDGALRMNGIMIDANL